MNRPSKQFVFGTVTGFALGSQLVISILALSADSDYWLGFVNGAGITLFLAYLLVGILGWCGALQRFVPAAPACKPMRSMTLGLLSGAGLFAAVLVILVSAIAIVSR